MMSKSEFLRAIEKMTESDEQTLAGGEPLEGLNNWDSLTVLSFISLLDREFGLKVSAQSVYQCKTVDDLIVLTGGQVAS